MNDSEVYALTALGERELRGARTTVTPEDIELLVRIDKVLSVGQIRSMLHDWEPGAFDIHLSRLIARGLLERQYKDPFADQMDLKPSRARLREVEQEAGAAAASLQKSGYFVRIARQRAARILPANRSPSALVVEDDPHLAKFLQHYLMFDGFEVRVAGNREEVLKELRTPPLDLVLLDVVLPDADGFDILYKMRAHPALKEVPVIMTTARSTREAVIAGLAGGADGYVTKPFEAEALMEAVHTVMGMAGGGAPRATAGWPERPR